MKVMLYSIVFTVIAFFITALIDWSFKEAITTGNLLKYLLFFVVLLFMFYFIERKNKQ
ncbi:hypothetical protein [Halobacillus sp. A5]|uniref:hypothetical protein n=1 Tax=Halobacillus sp. A5 TaxID=2880263 RepID=UPI0020A6AC64|nr:hypothetical protein [Halobacillus sp. A5]MCP3028716.1 hypothetical protein [Halobacillus sp. A5]